MVYNEGTGMKETLICWFKDLGLKDIAQVGGKNSSLGEMISNLTSQGVKVPDGFATTATAYRRFLTETGLDQQIAKTLDALDVTDIPALQRAGESVRAQILAVSLPADFEQAIREAYARLTSQTQGELTVAVRSSATAEDLADASFAGQQETYLNIRGIDNLLSAIRRVFASLFTDRAIAYRDHHGFNHMDVNISVGVQQMVRSDRASSGVMFTLDTESGFEPVVMINAAYGLGETVVQGAVNPDEFIVYKPNLVARRPAIISRRLGSKLQKMIFTSDNAPGKSVQTVDVAKGEQQVFCLSDQDIEQLAQYALTIEKHYQRPMDIEWGKDGVDGQLYILQARPETVQSQKNKQKLERFQLSVPAGKVLCEGRSVGQRIGQGVARVLQSSADIHKLQAGDVLVTDMTDPDWEPIMKKASAIVTNRGGRTCHAAIIARELGIPAVVGCGDATDSITDGEYVTVSCAEGDAGHVYAGQLAFDCTQVDVGQLPELPVKIMMNVGNPERAFTFQALPNEGVGLARVEFIISNSIGIHPKAILRIDSLAQPLQQNIRERTKAYASPKEFYITKLQEGIATLAAAFFPKPVIVRLSDFKSNEYANLLGGSEFEPSEENPMIGFRGASRYVAESFSDCFALECQAVKRVRETMGLTNVEVMIPFVRTVTEAKQVVDILAQNGLRRGEHGLRLIMMCEVPSNAILANEFLEYFDGFSIGSNDLTQLTLGLDRDSALVAAQFDERNPAVKFLLQRAIKACQQAGKYIGICGQGPSDHPDLAAWLLSEGIDSISLNPDSVVETWLALAKVNKR
jgi:pyruvate,water dikinase